MTRGTAGKGNWRGGRAISGNGYVLLHMPGHPRRHGHTNYVYEHIVVAERVLGKPLPDGVVIHHVNEIKTENRNSNLVICQDEGYHRLLHARLRALNCTGNANSRKCELCGRWDDPENMYIRRDRYIAFHPACQNTRKRELRRRKKVAQL